MAENMNEMEQECVNEINKNPTEDLPALVENNLHTNEESRRILSNEVSAAETVKTGRMPKLTDAIDRTVKRCVSAASLSAFMKNLPLKRDKDVTVLKKCHQQFKEQLTSSIKVEVETMFAEESIPQFMSDLDHLSRTSARGQIAWRPSGDPNDEAAAHLIQSYRKYLEKVKLMLQEEEAIHETVKQEVIQRRLTIANRLQIVRENNSLLKETVLQCCLITKEQLEPCLIQHQREQEFA